MSARKIAFALVGTGGIAAAAVATSPALLLNLARAMERGQAGFHEGRVTVAGHELVYLRGGRGPTALLVHGFAADKDNWTRLATHLTADYDVVALDLPGHGESTRDPDASYDIASQVARLEAFREALELGPLHLAGNSMGGHIATSYTVRYPDAVATLALLNPGGVTSPERSELSLALEAGHNPLLVENVEDYDRLLAFAFVEPPAMPGVVKTYFAERAVENRPFNDKIWGDLHTVPQPLEPVLSEVAAPTLVIWGDSDRVLDPSAAAVFGAGIPGAKVIIMEHIGHAPMIERPEETAALLLEHWAGDGG
jgi:abhydrolase domain-containing protein 6